MSPSHKRDEQAFLQDILEASAFIFESLKNVLLPDFVEDRHLHNSIILTLEQIGEASKHLSNETKRQYPTVPWKEIAMFRDFTVHHYWAIDYVKIWKTATVYVPQLLEALLDGETA